MSWMKSVWPWLLMPGLFAATFAAGLLFLPPEKTWIDWLQALLAPAVASGVAYVGWLNHRLALKKRNDDLFDKRLSLFQKITDDLKINRSVGPSSKRIDEIRMEYQYPVLFLFGAEAKEKFLVMAADAADYASDPNSSDFRVVISEDFIALFADKLRLQE